MTTTTAATIGTTATYTGTAHRWMTGLLVKIVAVHRGEDFMVDNDDDLARVGGIRPTDMVEVAPWLAKEKRFSWVTSDATPAEIAR